MPSNREQALREALQRLLTIRPFDEFVDASHCDRCKAIGQARAALAASEPASQGAQAGEFDARGQLLFAYESVLTEMRTYAKAEHGIIEEWVNRLDSARDEFAGRAAQPLQREAGLTEHDIEMTLLRSRLRTIHLAGTHGMSNREVADRVAELENLSDQARQYVQNAQQREHRINELEAQLTAAPLQSQVEELHRELRELEQDMRHEWWHGRDFKLSNEMDYMTEKGWQHSTICRRCKLDALVHKWLAPTEEGK